MIHLHTHSHYSILDGLGTVEEIVKRAVEIGAPAVAVTDHASISALPDLFMECEKAGIRPLIGCEFYLSDNAEIAEYKDPKGAKERRTHLTTIAKSWEGVRSIMERLTLANRQFYKRPRLSLRQALEFHDCIVMSACSIGLLSRGSHQSDVDAFAATYGDDFYLEIMPHRIIDGGNDLQRVTNQRALEYFSEHGLKSIATNDAHYVQNSDAYPHEVLLAIQTGKTWNDPTRWRFSGDGYYMRSTHEMAAAFAKNCPYLPVEFVKAAMLNTVEAASKCEVVLPKFKVALPSPNAGGSEESDLNAFRRELTLGWAAKIHGTGRNEAKYRDRLVYEIEVIKRLGFSRYFLIVQDIIKWSRGRGIMVGPARGSSAGSLVCYLMDITQLDPIRHELYFERFLNPERLDLPDIDVDFQDDRRQEVFEYIREKYGHDKTAQINTYGVLSVKSAFRDVARVFGVNQLGINALSKVVEDEDSFDSVPELTRFASSHDGKNIVDLAKKLSGRIRQNGVHAAGIIIGANPLTDVTVIERRKDVEVINWDMRQSERFALVKIDVLGLSTLSVLNRARKMIIEQGGQNVNFLDIPIDDQKSMEAFSRGDTVGVFQFEAGGMMALLKSLEAKDFETITAATALYRPGPLNSGLTKQFVQIARGEEYERYPSELLRPVLSPTKGIMVYQEQLMRVCVEMAGFTWPEADKMRKIMGKKLGADAFEEHRAHFVTGAKGRGVSEEVANAIFTQMVAFAGYAFNKAHAAAYSMLSVWTQFMKEHYPLEYMASDFTGTDSNERLSLLMRQCDKRGIVVKRPDVNFSGDGYTIDADRATGERCIVAPLSVIKGVGANAVRVILDERKKGTFLSMSDFQSRVVRRIVHSGVQKTLLRAGAFESLGHIESNVELREKDFAELMPAFCMLPSLTPGPKMLAEQIDMLKGLGDEIEACRMKNMPTSNVFAPRFKKGSYIMVVNNPVKGEFEHFQNEGSRYFLKTMKGLGFPEGAFYYTAPYKCSQNYQKVSADCQNGCMGFLRREIGMVRPKLIICFNSGLIGFFTSDPKLKLGELSGRAIYNKEFDAYVVFSPSPQFAYFKDEVNGSFQEAMQLVRQIYS